MTTSGNAAERSIADNDENEAELLNTFNKYKYFVFAVQLRNHHHCTRTFGMVDFS